MEAVRLSKLRLIFRNLELRSVPLKGPRLSSRGFFSYSGHTSAIRRVAYDSPVPLPQHLSQRWQSSLLRHIRSLRFNSSKPSLNPTPYLGSPEPAPSLSQRLKKLSREYGWSAMGVYLLLSAIDFPLCYLAVRMLGTERIRHWEHVIVEAFWTVVHIPFPDLGKTKQPVGAAGDVQETGIEAATREGVSSGSGGAEAAKAVKKGDAPTLWTQLALAYAVHKSLIVFRVPLTAALTPKVVKVLRGWGWDIGKRRPKPR